MISEKSIIRLKEQADIVDIISHYIPLKRAGSSYSCLCPFHDDKNPSMSISPQKQMFHCFSCKAGGDAIKFVMDYERLSYVEAIEKIAQLCNFSLEYEYTQKPKVQHKHVLQALNAHYRSSLIHNQQALNYLYKRGLDNILIDKFELGWAQDSASTIRLLKNEGIEKEEALSVGAIKQNDKGVYASFIERITFPIYNHTGALVGFGGRTMQSDNPAKYVNSPQNEVFDKSKLLYGYNIARKSINDTGKIIITEGYLDVIMLHKAGYTNAVAVLGTALTQKHMPLLKKSDISVLLCFDGDEAGKNAAIKSAHLLTIEGIDGGVVLLKGKMDPADMVLNGKLKELDELFNSAIELGKFYIRSIIEKYDIKRPALKQHCAEEIATYLKQLPSMISIEQTKFAARELNIDPKILSQIKPNQKEQNFKNIPKDQTIMPVKRNIPQPTGLDMLEAIVLKSIMNQPWAAQFVLEQKAIRFFDTYKDKFKLALNRDTSDDFIRELEFSDNIKPASSLLALDEAITHLHIRYRQKQQNALLNSDLNEPSVIQNLEKVAKILNLLKQKLQRLQ